MKTMLTTIFAVALMVFAFNASPVFAKSAFEKCMDAWNNEAACREHLAKLDNLNDPNQTDNENESAVADSGEEGSTSAAGADEQQ